MTVTQFHPVYDSRELSKLLTHWWNGSLDSIHSTGLPMVGVTDCDRRAWGLRAERLAERFISSDITIIIQSLTKDHPIYSLLLFFVLIKGIPLSDAASALDLRDESQAQALLISAQEEFVRRLLHSPNLKQS